MILRGGVSVATNLPTAELHLTQSLSLELQQVDKPCPVTKYVTKLSKSNQVRQSCKVEEHIFSKLLCCFCQVFSVFMDLQELIFSLSSVLRSNVSQVFGDMYLTVL